jgi:hypothetical protein
VYGTLIQSQFSVMLAMPWLLCLTSPGGGAVVECLLCLVGRGVLLNRVGGYWCPGLVVKTVYIPSFDHRSSQDRKRSNSGV